MLCHIRQFVSAYEELESYCLRTNHYANNFIQAYYEHVKWGIILLYSSTFMSCIVSPSFFSSVVPTILNFLSLAINYIEAS